MNRLDAIRRQLDEATPVPWEILRDSLGGARIIRRGPQARSLIAQTYTPDVTELIAHAPEDLRLLLAVAVAADDLFEDEAADALFEDEGDADDYQPPGLWARLGLALAALTEEEAG